jgi:hypothetical protein
MNETSVIVVAVQVDRLRALSGPLGENVETEIAMTCNDLFS